MSDSLSQNNREFPLGINDKKNGIWGEGLRKHLKLGGTILRGHLFPSHFLRAHFLKIKGALLCLMQNLGGGACAPSVPGSYVYVRGERPIAYETLQNYYMLY